MSANQKLEQQLGYSFKEPTWLVHALTHRSYGGEHNERLEFLGDSILNFVIADLLYRQLPDATEGELSRFRATLVSRDTLAKLAKEFSLGNYLILGVGELRSGGRNRESILSCAMEAIIGAIYMDGGMPVTSERIAAWYQSWLQNLKHSNSHKDPKTKLQEYLQSRRFALPEYRVEKISGDPHAQIFTVSCMVQELSLQVNADGKSRKRAEQEAAKQMLLLIERS